MSLLLTVAVLVGTVVTVYTVFPKRDRQLLTRAANEHRIEPHEYDIESPTPDQLELWSRAALGKEVPWPPAAPGVTIVGAQAIEVMDRRSGFVRYLVDGDRVTIVVQRNRDTPPRSYQRLDGDELVTSWRQGKWVFVAVGPAATADRWTSRIGAPR